MACDLTDIEPDRRDADLPWGALDRFVEPTGVAADATPLPYRASLTTDARTTLASTIPLTSSLAARWLDREYSGLLHD